MINGLLTDQLGFASGLGPLSVGSTLLALQDGWANWTASSSRIALRLITEAPIYLQSLSKFVVTVDL